MNLSISNFWRFYRASQAQESISADQIRKVRWNSHRKTLNTRNCCWTSSKRSTELGRACAVWNGVQFFLTVRCGPDQQQFIREWISADCMDDRSLGNAISMQNEPVEIVRCQECGPSTSQQDIETLPEKNRRYLLLLEIWEKTMGLLVGCILSSEISNLFLALARQTPEKS